MYKPFGQIPRPNPGAASDVANAARHVEGFLHDAPEPDFLPDSVRFPRPGVDIPSTNDSREVVEEVDPLSLPVSQRQDEESHEGAAGGVVDGGIEYLAFYKSFRDVMRSPATQTVGHFLHQEALCGIGHRHELQHRRILR